VKQFLFGEKKKTKKKKLIWIRLLIYQGIIKIYIPWSIENMSVIFTEKVITCN
jgi:hypothetical protein